MSHLKLNARITEVLGSFLDDKEMVEMHIDSVNILTSIVLDSDYGDAQNRLDMLGWLHTLSKTLQVIRQELSSMELML